MFGAVFLVVGIAKGGAWMIWFGAGLTLVSAALLVAERRPSRRR